MVAKRHVYLIAGYDPVGAEGHYRRFARGVATFARTWSVAASLSELSKPSDHAARHWTVVTQAPNWRVETTYQPLTWDDLVLGDFAGPAGRRVVRFARAMLEFFWTGTAFRFFRANLRYGFFFLFPLFYLVLFAAVAIAAGRGVAAYWQLQGVAGLLTVAAVAVAGFFVLLRWPGRRWRVSQAFDDWIFAWDFLHGRRRDMEARIEQYAQQLVERARAADCDEIVLVGHSLGATFVVMTVARALERDPALGSHGPTICVLTVGSTIPKFTLHPGAEQIRRDVARIADERSIAWGEYHARADPISFFKFDAVTGPIHGDRLERKPVIRLVRIRNMLEESTYRRIQLKFMRVHHQFVMANERRYTYDYFMMGCGPIAFQRTIASPNGAADLIAPDGTLIA